MQHLDHANTNTLIDMIFRGLSGLAGDLANCGYFALLTKEPYTLVDSGWSNLVFDQADEASYTGYARQFVETNSLALWRSTQGDSSVSSGTSGETGPAGNVYFPLCTNSSELVTHIALCYDLNSENINYLLAYWTLDRPIQLSNSSPGFYPCIPSSFLVLQIDG